MPLFEPPPNLPPPPVTDVCNSPAFVQAFTVLSAIHASAYHTLTLDESDPLRLKYHQNRLDSEGLPLLEALEGSLVNDNVGHAWITECGQVLGVTAALLENASHDCRKMYELSHVQSFILTRSIFLLLVIRQMLLGRTP